MVHRDLLLIPLEEGAAVRSGASCEVTDVNTRAAVRRRVLEVHTARGAGCGLAFPLATIAELEVADARRLACFRARDRKNRLPLAESDARGLSEALRRLVQVALGGGARPTSQLLGLWVRAPLVDSGAHRG